MRKGNGASRRRALSRRGPHAEVLTRALACVGTVIVSCGMYALALLRYRKPLDEVLAVVDEHRAYLKELNAQGLLLASGPFDPRAGGALLLRVPDEGSCEALDRIRENDPFTKKGMAQYELLPWAPTIG